MSKGRGLVVIILVALVLGLGPVLGGINLVTSTGESAVTCNGVAMGPSDHCDVTNGSTGRTTTKSYDEMKAMNGPKKPWGIALIVFGTVVIVITLVRAIRNLIRQN
jgi:hypothetical protein